MALSRKKFFQSVIIVLIASQSVFLSSSALAASDPTQGIGLEIAPPIVELSADPGQSLTFNIQLRNVTKGDVQASTKLDDFKAKDEDGNPGIIFNQTEPLTTTMKDWVENPGTFPIAAGEIKSLTIRLKVPSNASPGGHYGVIRFAVTPNGASGQGVAFGASVGTLMLITVNGTAKHNLSIAQFFTSSKNGPTSWFNKVPLTFVERFKNDGNVHEKPTGYIDIFGWTGKRAATIPVNNNPVKNVLPSSIRRFEQSYGDQKGDNKLWFGRYRADLSVIYGPNNSPLKSTIYFWVIPYEVIVVVIIILLLILAYFARRKLRARSKSR